MSTKMSTLFHEFVYDNELNGIDEIIRETNAVVAEDDIEVGTMLDDQVGEKYFYKCMELAENVIKSFEDEQPELNENQQIVLDWLKSDDHPNYSNIFDLFSDLLEYQVPTKVGEAFTEMMTDKKQQIQVLQAFSCWAIEQEEE